MFFQETSCSFVESRTILYCAYLKINLSDKIRKQGGKFSKIQSNLGFKHVVELL